MTIESWILLTVDTAVIAGVLLIISAVITARDIPPPIPTRKQVRDIVVKTFGTLGANDVFYDLGSGAGDMVIEMAHANPHTRCVGVEKFIVPWLVAQFRAWQKGARNAHFIRADMFKKTYPDATHIYAYLYPDTMRRLKTHLPTTVARGTKFLSVDFPLPDTTPKLTIALPHTAKRKLGKTLYIYEF